MSCQYVSFHITYLVGIISVLASPFTVAFPLTVTGNHVTSPPYGRPLTDLLNEVVREVESLEFGGETGQSEGHQLQLVV